MKTATINLYTFDELSDDAKDAAREWWRTGSPKLAFEAAINEAVDEIVRDMEYQDSDECVDEMLSINGYEFTEDGRIY